MSIRFIIFKLRCLEAGERRMAHSGVAAEIAALRREEAWIDGEERRLGRLQNRLMLAHRGNLIVVGYLPPGTWAELPQGWQNAGQLRLFPRHGLPPDGIAGPVAVSEQVAERMCERAVI